jgi:hypothetical protein
VTLKADIQKELLTRFYVKYPNTLALKIVPVVNVGGIGHQPGFDIRDVQGLLGTTRFNALMAQIVQKKSSVFCCAHDKWPDTHSDVNLRSAEVHCVYAADLDDFLKGGG